MRIEKLTVYGFGKHENVSLSINEQLAVFYGNNEAGKTTIQQFIIQILFGFPARNQTASRYEPKAGGKYGGQLHLWDEQYGKLIIERVKGKAAGDVTVYFEDGSRGSEMELKKILRDYDRASFEAVFSFSIHELQGLDKMTEDQLSRTLLASGTTGVDAITQMETELEKDMGILFKKGGRNPQLNLMIDKLKHDEKELRQHREQADLYGPFLKQLGELNVLLEELEGRENTIASLLAQARKQQQAAPLVEKNRRLEEQLELIGVKSFPADGSRRMDLLSERISEATAKQKHLKGELTALPEVPEEEKTGDGLEELIGKESEWHRFQSNFRNSVVEETKQVEELGRLLGLVGMSIEDALQFDVSLANEEKLMELAAKASEEEENSRFRERQLQDEKRILIEAEKEISYLESIAPTEEQLDAADKWPEQAARLAEAKAAQRLQNDGSNQLIAYILIAFAFAGAVTGFFREDMLIVLLAAGAAAAGFWTLWKARRKFAPSGDIEDIIQRFSGKEAEMEALQHKIAEHNRRVEEVLRTISKSDKKIAELENEANHMESKLELNVFLQHLGIHSSASKSIVIEVFKTIRKVQETHSKLKRAQNALLQSQSEEADWLAKAAALTGFQVQSGDLYTILRSEAKNLHERREQNRRLTEKRESLITEINRLTAYLNELESEKRKLLDESGAAEIEEFHQFHLDWTRKKELVQESALISSQLEAIGAITESMEEADDSAETRISDLENELSLLKNNRNHFITERAQLQQRVNHLLNDEEYEIKLQHFEEKKAEFNELAHRWSVNKAITEAIRNTMADLKEKSLPAVLSRACEFFERLTGGAYTGMEIQPDGHFEAIRNDDLRFRIAELSQATKEQAYLALRLSLAVSMQKSHPFPIIMDDPFVHFDRLRLQQVINLIKELQKDHQFIYFTCHEEMCEAWPEAQTIDVANTGRSVYL